jgi:hypothetical protein
VRDDLADEVERRLMRDAFRLWLMRRAYVPLSRAHVTLTLVPLLLALALRLVPVRDQVAETQTAM